MSAPGHFRALDSLRGICALAVCLFHMQVNSHIQDLWLVRNSWLFVDFFFVLSGFVIAANYLDRLSQGFSTARFMLLRFGRLYPLHLFVLALMVVTEFAKLAAADMVGGLPREPFSGTKTPEMILTNLALLQSFHVHDSGSWNVPAWSISAEFWTYLVFALAVAGGARVLRLTGLAILVCVPVWVIVFHGGSLAMEYDFGILRCLLGFAVGVVVWQIHAVRRPGAPSLSRWEVPVLVLVIVFVALSRQASITLAAPLVFGCATLVFAGDAGVVSRALDRPVWALMGLLSYSIYMVHTYVIARVENLCLILERKAGLSIAVEVAGPDGTMRTLLGPNAFAGDLIVLAMLAMIVGLSWCTYHWVERPGRDWFRALARRQAV